jgi:hypothetical protein
MNAKILKKLVEKEEALMDCAYSIRDYLDSTEDEELSYMGSQFCEALLEFIEYNNTMSINDIKDYLNEELSK